MFRQFRIRFFLLLIRNQNFESGLERTKSGSDPSEKTGVQAFWKTGPGSEILNNSDPYLTVFGSINLLLTRSRILQTYFFIHFITEKNGCSVRPITVCPRSLDRFLLHTNYSLQIYRYTRLRIRMGFIRIQHSRKKTDPGPN